MFDHAPDTEQQLSELQSQLDRLSLSLQQWQQAQEHLQPMHLRLAQLLDKGGEILQRLTATDERHAQAVGDVESRLGEWSVIEARLRERASSLDDIYTAAATSVSGIERAESRLVALESDMHLRLNQLSTDVQSLVAQLRGRPDGPPAAITEGAQAWPLEGIVRLHDELRQSSQASGSLPPIDGESSGKLAGRVESLELAVTVGQEEFTRAADRSVRQQRRTSVGFAALAAAVIVAAALALGLNGRVDARLNQAEARVAAAQKEAQAATDLANQRIASTREEAERQVSEAQQTARQAQTVSAVLAASDLVRFNLAGTAKAPRTSAQLLWSRSRGLVFSGSSVPAAPTGTTNQLWLLTNGRPVSAGVLLPDSKGRVMWVTDEPPSVSRQVIGAAMTVEPTGSQSQRSAAAVQARALAVTPPETAAP